VLTYFEFFQRNVQKQQL